MSRLSLPYLLLTPPKSHPPPPPFSSACTSSCSCLLTKKLTSYTWLLFIPRTSVSYMNHELQAHWVASQREKGASEGGPEPSLPKQRFLINKLCFGAFLHILVHWFHSKYRLNILLMLLCLPRKLYDYFLFQILGWDIEYWALEVVTTAFGLINRSYKCKQSKFYHSAGTGKQYVTAKQIVDCVSNQYGQLWLIA